VDDLDQRKGGKKRKCGARPACLDWRSARCVSASIDARALRMRTQAGSHSGDAKVGLPWGRQTRGPGSRHSCKTRCAAHPCRCSSCMPIQHGSQLLHRHGIPHRTASDSAVPHTTRYPEAHGSLSRANVDFGANGTVCRALCFQRMPHCRLDYNAANGVGCLCLWDDRVIRGMAMPSGIPCRGGYPIVSPLPYDSP
jgi:hypothetical protein